MHRGCAQQQPQHSGPAFCPHSVRVGGRLTTQTSGSTGVQLLEKLRIHVSLHFSAFRPSEKHGGGKVSYCGWPTHVQAKGIQGTG